MDKIDKECEDCAAWSNDELTTQLGFAAQDERTTLVSLLIRLGEFAKRGLPEEKGYSSAYDYGMRKLGMSRTATARRIAAAKAGRKFRSVLRMLERGELHLTAAAMLSKHLTSENHESLLRRAKGKSEEEIDRILASIAPRPVPKDRICAVRAHVRALPSTALAASPSDASPSAAGELFSPETSSDAEAPPAEIFDIRFAADGETRELLLRAKELLRHKFPKGETGAIVKLALKKLLLEIDRDFRKAGQPVKAAVGTNGRHVPEAVKQKAWERDGGQCAFVAEDGTRCTARAWLEFDHEVPFALGGTATPENIRPYCRPHNQWAARRTFGEWPRPPS